MRIALSLVSLFVLLIGFQNCSSSNNDPGFFVTAEPSTSNFNCAANDSECLAAQDAGNCYLAGLCEYPEEALWVKIKESNPYTINLFYQPAGLFTVGGTCGISVFYTHSFVWDVKASGSQAEVASGTADNLCINGRFSLPVNANVAAGQRYELTIELVGLGEGGVPVANPLPNNISRVDIVVINEEIQDLVDPNAPGGAGAPTAN